MTRRNYPDEITLYSADRLAFMADLESDWLEYEPHEARLISKDFVSGCADEFRPEKAA